MQNSNIHSRAGKVLAQDVPTQGGMIYDWAENQSPVAIFGIRNRQFYEEHEQNWSKTAPAQSQALQPMPARLPQDWIMTRHEQKIVA